MARYFLTLALLLGVATHSTAQIPVTDGGNLTQNIITAANAVLTAVNTANTYIRQGEQLINEYNILYNQGQQIAHMITNLQRIPEGLNMVDTVLAYGNKLTGLMSQTNAISYQLDSATKQFQTLYAEADTLAAQQQALQLTTLQHMQALQATAYRLQAHREAEDVVLERIRITVMQQFTAPSPEYTGQGGFLPTYKWTDSR